ERRLVHTPWPSPAFASGNSTSPRRTRPTDERATRQLRSSGGVHFTSWERDAELPITPAGALYVAVMVFLPRVSPAVEKLALSPTKFTGPAPRGVASAWNVTLPVGAAPLLCATVATNVTDWLTVEGFAEEVSAVVLKIWFICVVLEQPPLLTVKVPSRRTLKLWRLTVSLVPICAVPGSRPSWLSTV